VLHRPSTAGAADPIFIDFGAPKAHTQHIRSLEPFRFVVTCLAGWMNQEHRKIIDYAYQKTCQLSERSIATLISFTLLRSLSAKTEDGVM
jgi:hypothetical protein